MVRVSASGGRKGAKKGAKWWKSLLTTDNATIGRSISYDEEPWSRRVGRTMAFVSHVIAVTIGVAVALVQPAVGQQVGTIDLTELTPRVDLRHPNVTNGASSGPRGGTHELIECQTPGKNVGSLKVILVSLDRDRYDLGDHPVFGVRIENVGTAPIGLPFSANLSDLQPSDAGQKFSYSTLQVDLWFGGRTWSTNMGGGGFLLYGSASHPGTLLVMHPGEWVRIVGRGNISAPADFPRLTLTGDVVSQANAHVAIYNDETLVAPAATATVSRALCLAQTKGPSLPVALITK